MIKPFFHRKQDPLEKQRWVLWRWWDITSQQGQTTGPAVPVYLRRLIVFRCPWFSVFVHRIKCPDPDRHMHDHPWNFISFVLRGWYQEIRPIEGEEGIWLKDRRWFNFCRAEGAHRIIYVSPTCTTLVIHGRKTRKWGFHTENGWVNWETYIYGPKPWSDEWPEVTMAEWQQQGRTLFGPDVNDWRFVCPSCGYIQSRRDWMALGMNPRQVDMRLGYSCIGRWLDPLGCVDAFEMSEGTGCEYAGDQSPNISPLTVIISPGEERPTFGFDQS
jgi:hypothetical protein